MKKRRNPFYILYSIISIIILLCLDQFTKRLAILYLRGKNAVVLLPKILELEYLENEGMAFGMLSGKRNFFLIFFLFFCIFILYVFRKLPCNKYYMPLWISGIFMFSGALGNFIDRLLYGYVIDFIYVVWIHFPVFNIADILVVSGGITLTFLVIFKYQENDFNFWH